MFIFTFSGYDFNQIGSPCNPLNYFKFEGWILDFRLEVKEGGLPKTTEGGYTKIFFSQILCKQKKEGVESALLRNYRAVYHIIGKG